MTTERDLDVARAEFDAGFKTARLTREAGALLQLRALTLDDLDDFPICEQIQRLHGATARFKKYVAGKDDLSDMPNLFIKRTR